MEESKWKEEIQKEIQRLERKTLYLSVALISLVFAWATTSFTQARSFAVIQDYYYQSVELNQELLEVLEEQNNADAELLTTLEERAVLDQELLKHLHELTANFETENTH